MRPLRPQIEKTSPGRKGRNPPQAGPLGRDVPWILQSASCHESRGLGPPFYPLSDLVPSSLYGFGQKSTSVCEEPALYTDHPLPIAKRPGSSPGQSTLYVIPLPAFTPPGSAKVFALELGHMRPETLFRFYRGSNGSPRSNTGKSRRAPKGKTQADSIVGCLRLGRGRLKARIIEHAKRLICNQQVVGSNPAARLRL